MQLLITAFFFRLLFVFSPGLTSDVDDEVGHQLALGFSADASFVAHEEHLELAREIGITLLEITRPGQINYLPADGFFFLVDANEKFTTIERLQSSGGQLVRHIEQRLLDVEDVYPGRVAAVGLFRNPADFDDRFASAAGTLADSLRQQVDKPFYYHSAFSAPAPPPGGIDFAISRLRVNKRPGPDIQSQMIYSRFEPSRNTRESLEVLEAFLNHSLTADESIVILPAGWFFSLLEAQPDLKIVFSAYLEGESVAFPLPEGETHLPDPNWLLIILLVVWGSFIVHYRYQPTYPSLVLRYFFNHSFFVDDVMENRFRNISAGLTIILQHAVITGLFFLTLASYLFGSYGYEIVSHYFPFIILSGLERPGIFLLGLLTGLLSHVVSLVWVYVTNKKYTHPSQVINLYGWPLSLNLLSISLLVYLVLRDARPIWIAVTSSVFLFVWFMSFNTAVIDGARYLDRFRVPNIVLNLGFYLIVIAVLALLAAVNPAWVEPLQLAISLP